MFARLAALSELPQEPQAGSAQTDPNLAVDDLEVRLGETRTAYVDGRLVASIAIPLMNELEQKLSARRKERAASLQTAARQQVQDDLESLWPSLSVDQRRAHLANLLLSVTMLPPGRGARRFDPSTVQPVWRQ